MIDRSDTRATGNRTIRTWTRTGNTWSHTDTVQTGIIVQTETFGVTNGTGGDPQRRLATPMSFNKVRQTHGSGYQFSGDPESFYVETFGAGFGSAMLPSISAPTVDTDTTQLFNRALERVCSRGRAELDLIIDLIEARSQTGPMIRGVTNLVNFVRGFHPRRWADRWLELQYGWRPLVNSIYGLAHAAVTPPREGMVTIKERARETVTGFNRTNVNGVQQECYTTMSKRVEICTNLNFKPGQLQQLGDITSMNPAGIVWELVPYSFVADWVINIGGYLRLAESAYLMGLIFDNGYATVTTQRIDAKKKFGRENTGPSSYTQYGGCESLRTQNTKSRTRLTGFPGPYLPRLNVNMGAGRCTSAGALMYQHWGRR